MDSTRAWAMEEFGQGDLGHRARVTRGVSMLATMAARPSGTVHATFRGPAALKGAYRWLERPTVPWDDVATTVHDACALRSAEHALTFMIIDGSSIAHTDHAGTHGVGRVGSDHIGAQGLKSMIALAMTYDGVPLGVAAHALWARGESASKSHAVRALVDKESHWWTTLQAQVETSLANANAATQCWYLMDREADASHVLLRGLEPGVLFTVRAHQNRLLTAQRARRAHLTLHAALETAPPCAHVWLVVPRAHDRPERVACVELRVAHVGVKLRAQWSHRKLGDVPLTAVVAREIASVPQAAKPLSWLLLTSWPVHGADDAVRVVRAYALRFRIEAVHQTWKSSACDVEASELRSFGALAKWATLQLAVAVHVQHTLHRSRTEPDVPADEIFTREELDAAQTLAHAERIPRAPALGTAMTLGYAVALIARLGGYSARHGEGPPGPATFTRGYELVAAVASAFAARRKLRRKPPPPETSGQ